MGGFSAFSGNATVEIVAAVATDDPEIAAKILQETIVAMAPQKSYKFNDFKETNQMKDCIIQEFIEGTMINCFYFDNKWVISTRSVIGADCRFNKEGKTFLEMFNDGLDEIGFNLNLLDPQYSYSFVLQHPENRIVVPFELPNIFLVEIYYKQNLDRYSDHR